MLEVKRIFHEKYRECDINQLPEYDRGKYKLGNIKNPVVYSIDEIFLKHPGRGGSRCDEFIFFDLTEVATGIYLVELKDSGNINVEKVKDQLQGGADFIENFLADDPATDDQPFDFFPYCVSKGIRQSARIELRQCKIYLHSRYGHFSKRIKHIFFNDTLQ